MSLTITLLVRCSTLIMLLLKLDGVDEVPGGAPVA